MYRQEGKKSREEANFNGHDIDGPIKNSPRHTQRAMSMPISNGDSSPQTNGASRQRNR